MDETIHNQMKYYFTRPLSPKVNLSFAFFRNFFLAFFHNSLLGFFCCHCYHLPSFLYSLNYDFTIATFREKYNIVIQIIN